MPTALRAGIIATTAVAVALIAVVVVPWLTRDDEPAAHEQAVTPRHESAPADAPERLPEGIKESPVPDELTLPLDAPVLSPDSPVRILPQPLPGPGPKPEPEPEPVPVDLSVGTPTIAAASEPDEWMLTVPVLGSGSTSGTSFTIELQLTMTETTGFVERVSSGWDCGGIEDGDDQGNPYFFDSATCRYTYQPGQTVTPFQLVIFSINPAGTVAITGTGNDDPDTSNDSRTF